MKVLAAAAMLIGLGIAFGAWGMKRLADHLNAEDKVKRL